MRLVCIATILALSGTTAALAQTETSDFSGDISVEAYLALLAQVAPAARDGAQEYMAAFLTRCGRTLTVVELREAFAQGTGNPTLLAMVRASQASDRAEIGRLGATLECPRS